LHFLFGVSILFSQEGITMAEYSLAQRLRMARARTGIKQKDLAEQAGLHPMQLSKLERGITKEITGSTLRVLCKALGVSPQYLLGMTDDMEREPAVA
jgi:transcriptional regulator with XRE-family HTH domain